MCHHGANVIVALMLLTGSNIKERELAPETKGSLFHGQCEVQILKATPGLPME